MTTAYSRTCTDLDALTQDDSRALGWFNGRFPVPAASTLRASDPYAQRLLEGPGLRVLEYGLDLQARWGLEAPDRLSGGVTALRATFARDLGITEREVKHWFAILLEMGLKTHDVRLRRVPRTRRQQGKKIYDSEVAEINVHAFLSGVEMIRGLDGKLVFPCGARAIEVAKKYLDLRSRWGGKRAGAGRPKKVHNVKEANQRSKDSQEDRGWCGVSGVVYDPFGCANQTHTAGAGIRAVCANDLRPGSRRCYYGQAVSRALSERASGTGRSGLEGNAGCCFENVRRRVHQGGQSSQAHVIQVGPPKVVSMYRSDQVPSELAAAKPAAGDSQANDLTISAPCDPVLQADAGVVRPTTELNPRRRLQELGKRLIPPTPDYRLVAEVKTPNPRLLPADTSRDAAILADAYVGATRARWFDHQSVTDSSDFCPKCFGDHRRVRGGCGRLERTFKKLTSSDLLDRAEGETELAMLHVARPAFDLTDSVRQKFEGQLLAAAARMREYQIAPAAWCMFSCDVWLDAQITEGPPTVAFVFSAQRLTERLGWFEDARARYVGGTVLLSGELRLLAQKHADMWREILRESPQERPSLQVIVDRHFPGVTYDKLLEDARRGQAALQARVDDMVKRGLSLWV